MTHKFTASARTLLALATLALVAPGQVFAQANRAPARNAQKAAPAPAPVVPQDYLIGPEDVLGVLFWRETDISGDVTVRPDGQITLPLIGELKAAGLTPAALQAQVLDAAQKFLTDPNVSVVVKQMNSRKIFITGQVGTAGAYPLTGPRTVMQAIALAGGVTEYADREHITVMRQEANGTVRTMKFNYKDVAKGKKLEQNVQLLPGDTIVVP